MSGAGSKCCLNALLMLAPHSQSHFVPANSLNLDGKNLRRELFTFQKINNHILDEVIL
jgi:hypothetical protein